MASSGELADASLSLELSAAQHSESTSSRHGSKTAGVDGGATVTGMKEQAVNERGASHTSKGKQSSFFL